MSRKDRPIYRITPDSSICWIEEPFGIEIFFPEPGEQEITCCGKDGEMNYIKEFPYNINLFEIEKWALEKMNYYGN